MICEVRAEWWKLCVVEVGTQEQEETSLKFFGACGARVGALLLALVACVQLCAGPAHIRY